MIHDRRKPNATANAKKKPTGSGRKHKLASQEVAKERRVSRDTRRSDQDNWERTAVAEATGVGEATAGRALALANKAITW